MKVKATRLGIYGLERKKPGSVFELVPVKLKNGKFKSPDQQFSAKWMEKVEVAGGGSTETQTDANPDPKPKPPKKGKGKGKGKGKDVI